MMVCREKTKKRIQSTSNICANVGRLILSNLVSIVSELCHAPFEQFVRLFSLVYIHIHT